MTDGMLTPHPTEWDGMTEERHQAIVKAVEAIRVQRKGLQRIFVLGRAFEELQTEAMQRSHSNQPHGIRYNEAYRQLERPIPELAETSINKTDRNQYIWCWQRRDELEAWLLWRETGMRSWVRCQSIPKSRLSFTGRRCPDWLPSGRAVSAEIA